MPVLAFTWGSYAEIWRSSWAWLSDSHPRISNYFAQSLNESLCSCTAIRCVIDYLRQTHDMCILVCGIIDALLLNILIHMISLWGHCFIKNLRIHDQQGDETPMFGQYLGAHDNYLEIKDIYAPSWAFNFNLKQNRMWRNCVSMGMWYLLNPACLYHEV